MKLELRIYIYDKTMDLCLQFLPGYLFRYSELSDSIGTKM